MRLVFVSKHFNQKQQSLQGCSKDELVLVVDVDRCISCGACAKACQFGAITMVDHIPVIDHSKCIGCMACSDVCPTGAMNPKSEKRKIAYIDAEKCSGCNECTSYCKFGAIKGSEGEKHLVLKACTGCGLCVEHCKEQAIGLRTRWTSRDPKDKA